MSSQRLIGESVAIVPVRASRGVLRFPRRLNSIRL